MELKRIKEPTKQEAFWSFNRTILELKPRTGTGTVEIMKAFNRTILELKRETLTNTTTTASAFNRTILELKPDLSGGSVATTDLLIVPFWN